MELERGGRGDGRRIRLLLVWCFSTTEVKVLLVVVGPDQLLVFFSKGLMYGPFKMKLICCTVLELYQNPDNTDS